MKIKLVLKDEDLVKIETAYEFERISDTLRILSHMDGPVLATRHRYDPDERARYVEIITRDEYPTPSEAIKAILSWQSKFLEKFLVSE